MVHVKLKTCWNMNIKIYIIATVFLYRNPLILPKKKKNCVKKHGDEFNIINLWSYLTPKIKVNNPCTRLELVAVHLWSISSTSTQFGPQQLKYMTILRDSSDCFTFLALTLLEVETNAEDAEGGSFLAWETDLSWFFACWCADLSVWFHMQNHTLMCLHPSNTGWHNPSFASWAHLLLFLTTLCCLIF